MNRDSRIASSPISQCSFFEEVRGHIEFFKFDITIKKKKNSNSSKT